MRSNKGNDKIRFNGCIRSMKVEILLPDAVLKICQQKCIEEVLDLSIDEVLHAHCHATNKETMTYLLFGC